MDIQRLPYFAVHGALKHVYELYVDAFDAVTNIPFIRNEQEDDEFTKLLLKLVAESIHLVDVRTAFPAKLIYRRQAKNGGINSQGCFVTSFFSLFVSFSFIRISLLDYVKYKDVLLLSIRRSTWKALSTNSLCRESVS